MMRIAIAGTGGLALLMAHYVNEETAHQLVILSRSPKPGLTAQGYQVEVVDYEDPSSLHHALMGVDTVISTVTGDPQLRLIDAAVQCRVRRFAPAEYEGRPSSRPTEDPLDRGKSAALQRLTYYRNNIVSTVFVCGVMYERFAPGGLSSQRIGFGSGISNEGDYILDLRQMSARVPAYDDNSGFVSIAMTGAENVAEFVVRALDLREWPSELLMCGQRLLVRDLQTVAEQAVGRQFDPSRVQWDNPDSLRSELAMAQYTQDWPRQMRAQHHLVTAEGRLDFVQPNLNAAFPNVELESFADWLQRVWTTF